MTSPPQLQLARRGLVTPANGSAAWSASRWASLAERDRKEWTSPGVAYGPRGRRNSPGKRLRSSLGLTGSCRRLRQLLVIGLAFFPLAVLEGLAIAEVLMREPLLNTRPCRA
jgi:hypothetical protein